MLLRELLRTYQWTVIDSTPSVENAVSLVRQGQAFLIIVDDTLQIASVKHIRYLLSDPVALCTPILSFLVEGHKNETTAIQRLAPIEVVEKPLTPSKFIPGFVRLVKNWEKEPLASVRRANYQVIGGNEAQGLRTLLKLTESNLVGNLCSQAFALHLRRLGRMKEAEGVLLKALKAAPRELGNIIALSDLYLNAAMPKLAYRLLNGAKQAFAQSLAVYPDLVQAALLLGHIDDAIGSLYQMHKGGFMEEETASFLARLLFAEGREAEAEKILNSNKTAFKRIQSGWTAAEQHNSNPAAAS